MIGECWHFTDAENALENTWVIDEVRFVVDKVYIILEIHEIYQYQFTQYNPTTGEGGLFVKYVITFLNLKIEYSGYPSWVRNPDDEDQ